MSIFITKYKAPMYRANQYVTNQEQLHKLITKAAQSDRKSNNILYRLEYDYPNEEVWLFVQADKALGDLLDWNEKTVFKMAGDPVCLDERLNDLKEGDLIKLQLRCSPSRRPRKADNDSDKDQNGTTKRKKKYLSKEEDRKKWMQRRGEMAGLELLGYKELRKVSSSFKHSKLKKEYQNGNKEGYDVLGLACIKDIQALKAAINEGIGEGKSYGFGMLLVRAV